MPDFPWIKSYPPNVAWNAAIDTVPVCQLLDDAARAFPSRIALEFNGKTVDYAELQKRVNCMAKGLQQLGVAPGVKVGLYLPNTPHYVIAFFALLRAGATVVNYSPLDAERVLEHKIADSETDFIITLDQQALYPVMQRLLGVTRLKSLIVGNVNEMSSPAYADLAVAAADLASLVAWDANHVPFAQLLDNDGQYAPVALGDPQQSIAVLQYTGGTTGLPKGAMLTHANLSAGAGQALLNLGKGGAGLELGRETLLVTLPLFHIYSLTFNLLLGMALAARLVLHARFELEPIIRDLADKHVTVFFGVPTMFTAIVGRAGVQQCDFSSLRFSNSGGAPLPLEVHERFQDLTGCRLQEGWGMTETCGIGTNTPAHLPHKIGSCGVPLCGVVIQFVSVDDPKKILPYGEVGEICIAGPNVMRGYWKNPAATDAEMTSAGFLRTGDVGRMDEDGYLWIVDRIKDMILCSGYNVYPRNIEEAIYRHPAVAEVLVVGVDDRYRGQTPKAFMTLKEGASAPTLDAMKEFLKADLGKHEMIQALEIRTELPRTNVGKLSRKILFDEEKKKASATVVA